MTPGAGSAFESFDEHFEAESVKRQCGQCKLTALHLNTFLTFSA